MHSRLKLALRGSVLILLCSLPLAGVQAQELTVMISGGLSAAFKELAPQFEKSTGLHLQAVYGPSMGSTPGAIPVRLARGEVADVVIMVRSALDELARERQVTEGSQVDLAYSRIGMAVRAGTIVPNIGTVEQFRKALLRAKSVAYSDSASGVYVATELFKRLGIEREMAEKSRRIPAEPVGVVVARGDAEIGFQQMSELKPISGITIVGLIPEELQHVTVFSAGIVANSRNKDGARAFIGFLSSTAACEHIRKSSMDPANCPLVAEQVR